MHTQIPWRAQQRVWQDLSELGLLLLLDPPRQLWLPLLHCTFHPHTMHHPLVVKSAATALLTARGGKGVLRGLLTYHNVLQLLACAIFGPAAYGDAGTSAGAGGSAKEVVCITGKGVHRLLQLLNPLDTHASTSTSTSTSRDMPPAFILQDVIALYVHGRHRLGGLYSGSSSGSGSGSGGEALGDIWDTSLCVGPAHSPYSVEGLWAGVGHVCVQASGVNIPRVSLRDFVESHRSDCFE